MKLILIDCDGVLLDWKSKFEEEYGVGKDSYSIHNVLEFNQSRHIENLETIAGAEYAIKWLHETLGYKFHVVTHIGDNDAIRKRRMNNLINKFGAAPFYKIDCISHLVPKETILKKYKDSGLWWVDNYWKNVKTGQELGLLLIHFSKHRKLKGVITSDDWFMLADVIHSRESALEYE